MKMSFACIHMRTGREVIHEKHICDIFLCHYIILMSLFSVVRIVYLVWLRANTLSLLRRLINSYIPVQFF